MKFELQDPRDPAGDQPQAIAALVQGLRLGRKYQTLEGVTGSGKTFVMAKIIEQVQRPTLVLSPNKLLARQTHRELAAAFPNNAVHYYVSDCVNIVPETYDPEQDRYDSGWVTRDRELTGMRKAALASLLTRRDVIVVGSVSVVFGTASPEDYRSDRISLEVNDTVDVDQLLARKALRNNLVNLLPLR